MVNQRDGNLLKICLKNGNRNYTRVSTYDGREDDLSDILKGKYPDGIIW